MIDELDSCMNFNMLIIDSLTKHIQALQDIDADLAFFAIEAQENLMKGHTMILRKRHIDKENK